MARGHVWRSTFNGAKYSWREDQWMVSTHFAPDWHPIKAGVVTEVVYAQPMEKFEVVEGEVP
ncbi:MAG TPA: hypothetical protein VHL57_03855 [Flavobacteriales bacterium]|nr:hypothetical protein [Flavobacteriales bacterium]